MDRQIKRYHQVLFIASIFCFWLSTYSYVPIFSIYLEEIPFSYGLIGIILGSYGITQVMLRFPLGVLLDRLSMFRKHFYVGGFVVAIISGLILLFSTSFAWILTGRLLAGVTAAMWVMATIMYAEYFEPKQSGRAMGILQFSTVMSQFLSMLSAGLLVEWLGLSVPFWVGVLTACIGLVLALCIKVVPQEENTSATQERNSSLKHHIKATIAVKGLLPLTLISMFAHALLFISIFGFTPVYASAQGISEGAMIWVMVAFFVPHAAASLFVAFFNVPDKSEMKIVFISLLTASVAFFIMPLMTNLATISLFHGIIGLAIGFVLPMLLSQIATLSDSTLKTSVMGFYQSIYALGIFIGPYMAGYVAQQRGLSHVFSFAGWLSLIALTIAGILMMKHRKQLTN
ncbi:transport protein [Bacillus sp. JCM 19045]|nr:transport protein [Bacillus sp. JCM 19045]